MKIIDSNYCDFPNAQILGLPSYIEASKRLSFSFRDGEPNQDIFAYASLKPFGESLQIIDYDNTEPLSYERFFDRIKMTAVMANEGGKFRFSCLCFSVNDISEEKAKLLIEYIDGFEYNESTKTYQCCFKRENAPE